jgi:precorrin-6B methylase 2
MDHDDHVSLLRPADLPRSGTWADLGAGSGAFTLALSDLVGLSAEIYAIDRDKGALSRLEQSHRARFGTSQNIHTVRGDFTGALSLPPLDGILMANSLHFYRQ